MDKDEARRQVDAIEKAEDKYVYFLLAVAAAAIAYAMERTINTTLQTADVLFGLAIICWAASFWAGCTNREGRLEAAFKTLCGQGLATGLKADLEAKGLSETPEVARELTNFIAKVESEATKASASAQFWYNLQFTLLVIGAICFFLWHLAGMISRTLAANAS